MKHDLGSLAITCMAVTGIFLATASAEAQTLSQSEQQARDIYQELIEINTTQSVGDTLQAAKAMAARLATAGYPADDVQVFEVAPKRGNLVARYRGGDKEKPMLLVAHLDVVEAKPEDWSTDPFKLVEKDGYFYARGSSDDKYMAAALVNVMAQLKQEKFKANRDIVLVLETDEEIRDADGLGITWLIKNHKALLDAEFALNEGDNVGMKDGQVQYVGLQTSEKLPQSYWLEVRNKGGHSSRPTKDNAIYRLAEGLTRLEKYDFPLKFTDTTRVYLDRMSKIEGGQVGEDMAAVLKIPPDPAAVSRLSALPPYNAILRTTCVATRLEGGHADNALPQLARAMVNCRIMPGTSPETVNKTLVQVLADDQISVVPLAQDTPSAPSPLNKKLIATIEKVAAKFWPGVPLLPTLSTGATDSRFLRNIGIPSYGHSGLADDIFDNRLHGKDERILVKSFYDGQAYLYELIKALAGAKMK
jgi:acetylornithine deacetylase/succinyl-diaminopimelate desuccinylase-like protein